MESGQYNLSKDSLPYMNERLWRLKLKAMFQNILDPVQTQTKKTFVGTVFSINQSWIAFSDDSHTLSDHPNVRQTSGNQQTAQTGRVSQMTLVNVKASVFLVREECLNSKTSPIITTGIIWVIYICNQKNWLFIATVPPTNEIERHRWGLSEANILQTKDLAFLQWVVSNRLIILACLDINLRRSA